MAWAVVFQVDRFLSAYFRVPRRGMRFFTEGVAIIPMPRQTIKVRSMRRWWGCGGKAMMPSTLVVAFTAHHKAWIIRVTRPRPEYPTMLRGHSDSFGALKLSTFFGGPNQVDAASVRELMAMWRRRVPSRLSLNFNTIILTDNAQDNLAFVKELIGDDDTSSSNSITLISEQTSDALSSESVHEAVRMERGGSLEVCGGALAFLVVMRVVLIIMNMMPTLMMTIKVITGIMMTTRLMVVVRRPREPRM
jgi:hypothetical protein